ncbi:MAG: 3-oxoacyl-ACP synthase [Nitrospirae bacterium CG_4_10_14_3_um_filter_44_29]|nr:ketoacyl-ACP synthase III [Nitrospirota bacterium]OIO31712.1 MAG: 3-oxoacyl-ACP synthase [Nitrospirae bacterium CG1_02_44_142]PIP70658.1 MAG: 3-oxoacyl-ACP synthase [Nitrospirae bacterium CG22_combo_CG10-13_8_21_14_all_44_11]PIV40671.1 MAG: 3-oxoacyl-ACP synthase [Nitrospirae bacterium CG02_land_8_20_14_3_00_44_33]PIV67157.1 MAG: 3-oxoacyl-ACP synthase [Nitrospirae bacterium CG01_land_8_20_14_3_00_44_22]PIW89736.1 MAG: 3-oxoacyl-ACP synthase [Nitrospirae bacterium CG_4_8_14_3_um_filter_44_2
MLRAKIIATGSYVPKHVLTNFDLEKMVDTSDEWIRERSGIRERRIADEKEAASDLACEAAKAAFKRADIKPKDIELIIVATVTGDMPTPATACHLQHKLGIKKAAAFDVNAACSGFLYGLSIADSFIKSGAYKKILIVGAEVLSRVTDWEDRTTCVLFGDGAGAVILKATDEDRGIVSTHIRSNGALWELLNMPGGGSRNPASKESLKKKMHYLRMKGNETFKIAVRTLENLVARTLEENKLKPSQLSLLIPHQANLRIIQATAERLNIPMEKVFVNIDKYGNTSAASIPIALDEAVRQGRVRDGDYVLLEAFGGGLTWASVLIKW